MPAFGAQPALVYALIDQTRGVFFARARTHRQSFRNKISQPFMMEVVGNRRKSWGVVGSLKKLV